jgi:AcrR family transcriptional regulator
MKETGVREKILETAFRLFFEQGYNLTGINQIIEEADIARGSLYNHFKSKNDLLMSYLREAEVRYFAKLDAFIRPIKDPRKKLLAVFDFRIGLQQQYNFAGCRFIKLGAEVSRDQTDVLAVLASHKRRFKEVIRSLANEVEIKAPFTADTLTETMYLLIEGASVIGALEKSDLHFKEAKKIISDMV